MEAEGIVKGWKIKTFRTRVRTRARPMVQTISASSFRAAGGAASSSEVGLDVMEGVRVAQAGQGLALS